MDITQAIQQASSRAGRGYKRIRGTEKLAKSIEHWRDVEKPERVLNRMEGLGLRHAMVEVAAAAMSGTPNPPLNVLERVIDASQLISSVFLPLGAERTRAVGRIVSESGRGFGTGFLISPRLLMTNNHVLDSASLASRCRVQFDFVKAIDGSVGATEIYRFLPDAFFLTAIASDALNLDYTVVAVEETNADGRRLADRGSIPLIAASGKLVLGDLANIIQHPGGEAQQVALRDSKVVTPLEHFIRYEADTQPGSSGSPVFNDLWQVAALHHSGVPEEVRPGVFRLIDGGEWDTRQPMSHEDQLRMGARVKWIANEGVRISSIVREVQERLRTEPAKLSIFEEAVRERGALQSPNETVMVSSTPRRSTAGAVSAGYTATWTVPLKVTVQLGPEMQLALDGGTVALANAAPAISMPQPALSAPAVQTAANVDVVTARARVLLADRREILEVRPGFRWIDGGMTDTEAVVVVLDPNAPLGPGTSLDSLRIPREIDGVPIDVTVGGATAAFRALARLGDGAFESMPLADLLQERVPSIGYVRPANLALDEVDGPMEVICHASPDDGWPVLREFLDRTTSSITLGMFDLSAPHIVDKFKELAGRPGFRMNLAIQRGMAGGLKGTKKDDIPEDDFIAEMKDLMSDRFRQAFVDVTGDDRTFASAYHIKVAIRDHEELWLSSGNMQTSNQPDRSPAADGEDTFGPLRDFNREWHVVIKHKKLATTFEKFLLHDLAAAEDNPAEPPRVQDEVLVPLTLAAPEPFEAERTPRYVARRTFPRKTSTPVRIQPLLTPDNFLDRLIPIVESAQTTLFIQNQSLSLLQPLDKNEPRFLDLFSAIRTRQKAGVDVRLIFRVMRIDEDAARATKDALVRFGLKKNTIFVQENCHTKGVIVDSRVAVIGSHNWTNQGAIANRDASLIIHHTEIAQYYEQIFLFDWETLTREPKPPKLGKKAGEEGLAAPTARVKVTADELILGD